MLAGAVCTVRGGLQGVHLPLPSIPTREKGNRQTMLAPGGKTHGDS
jgi:hypothetical protein